MSHRPTPRRSQRLARTSTAAALPASTQTTAIYSLPPEIHGQIVPYLTDPDLREYRLTCKYFAAIGARELFSFIAFHASSASVHRLHELAEQDSLRKCVRTLVWDSNLWDIDIESEDGLPTLPWRCDRDLLPRLLENYRKLYQGSYWLPRDIETEARDTKAHILVHKKRCQDERKILRGVLHPRNISTLLQRFPALRGIRIVNGRFEIKHRALQKTQTNILRNTLDLIPRGDHLFHTSLEGGPLGVHALVRAVEGLSALQRPWKLEIDAIDYSFFTPDIYPEGFETKLGKLTSLALTLSSWRGGGFGDDGSLELITQCKEMMKVGIFKHFLRSMIALRSLSLSFHERRGIDRLTDAATICDMVPLEDWTGLRELSLTNINATEEDLIRLVQNHAPTLQKLRLEDVRLSPDGSWIRVLEAIQPVLKLTSATFDGDFLCDSYGQTPGALAWWLDEDMKSALSKYLIRGGVCPLRGRIPSGTGDGDTNPRSE